ncbi:MAG: hypothetical protein NTV44_01080 [Firmicutes bacterium]|nr:hypothetical protein [Bacillota bacterium]
MNLEYGVLPTEMLISNPSAVPEYFESVSITPSNVSIDFAELIFYLEQPLTIDVAFSVELYLADALIENQAIELPTDPSLQAGPHTIVFENLTAETTYSAILKANYINPDTLETRNDVLSTIEFTTMPNVVQTLSGSISNYLIDASIDLQTNPQFLRYDVTTIYADPQSEVSSVTLEYGYVPTAVLLMNPNAVPQSYSSVSVTGSSQDSWIEGIPNVNCTVFLRLIALLKNTETVILDEAQFETPLMIMADMTISDISYDYVIFSCFAEPNATTEITYTIELYDSDVLVETKTVPDIVSQPGMPNQGGNSQSVRFENLANPEHLYTAKLVATYIDSHTSETVVRIIQSMEFTTTAQYSYDVTVTPTEFTYEIGILIHDSQFVLSNITYSIFSGVAGNLMYVTGGPLTTDTPDGTDRYYMVSISKQAYTGYTLELLGSKTVNGVVYLSCLLYTIVL